MPATTPEILLAHRNSHTIGSRAWLLLDEAPMVPISNLLPGGTITLDTTSDNMRSCQFQFVDNPLRPLPKWLGKMTPDGVSVKLEQGFSMNGAMTWFPAGIFDIEEVDIEHSSETPGPTWTVQGQDRSYRVGRSIFQKPYTVKTGTPVHQAVYAIIHQQVPWLKRFNLQPTVHEPWPQSFQTGDDPWQACVELAQAAGMVLYFDAKGVLVLRDTPGGKNDRASISIDTSAGRNTKYHSVATDIKRVVSNNPGYNGIIATATTTQGKALTVVVFDENKASDTYYQGPYGMVPAPPVEISSAKTMAQLTKAARNLLPSVLGLTRSVASTIVHAPWIDAYDLVWVNAPQIRVTELQMVTGFTLGLDYQQLMQVTTVPLGVPPTEYISAVADLTGNYAPVFN